MAYNNQKSSTLLSAVTATGAGSAIDVSDRQNFTFFLTATAVTSGATVTVQGQNPDDSSTWFTIKSFSVTGTASVPTSDFNPGSYKKIRGNMTARTDGTYTLRMLAARRPTSVT